MSATLDTACPNCQKVLRIAAEHVGKKIRCKSCGEVFEVKALARPPVARPLGGPAPARPAAARPAAAPPAAPANAPIPFKDDPPPAPPPPPPPPHDDDDGETNPYGMTNDEMAAARCPHCAQVLDPPDTKICLLCGYDLLARRRHDSKTVYAPEFMDYVSHLGPGVAAALAVLLILAFDVYSFANMREWLSDSVFATDDKDPVTKEKIFILPPLCFNLWLGIISTVLCWTLGKFAVKRLVQNPSPPERVKDKDKKKK